MGCIAGLVIIDCVVGYIWVYYIVKTNLLDRGGQTSPHHHQHVPHGHTATMTTWPSYYVYFTCILGNPWPAHYRSGQEFTFITLWLFFYWIQDTTPKCCIPYVVGRGRSLDTASYTVVFSQRNNYQWQTCRWFAGSLTEKSKLLTYFRFNCPSVGRTVISSSPPLETSHGCRVQEVPVWNFANSLCHSCKTLIAC